MITFETPISPIYNYLVDSLAPIFPEITLEKELLWQIWNIAILSAAVKEKSYFREREREREEVIGDRK